MIARVCMRAYGRTVAIRAASSLHPLIREHVPPTYRFCSSDVSPDASWTLTRRSGSVFVESFDRPLGSWPLPDAASAVRSLMSDVELWVAEHARRVIFVHAGCVVVDGRAIVLPGRSMAGKTTLTAALVRAGAVYYSDEYAVFDSAGLVRPYPRQLQIRPVGGGMSVRTPVDSLGGIAGRGPAPVGLMAALKYDAAAGWHVTPLSPGRAVLSLIDNTVAARSRPRAALAALAAAASASSAVSGTRGDADAAALSLIETLRHGALAGHECA